MRVAVVGTGLIGGSVGLALARRGHEVVGFDRDDDRLAARQGARRGQRGRRDRSTTRCATPTSSVVAVPVGRDRRGRGRRRSTPARAVVTDVGSVKGPVVAAVEAARPDAAAALRRRPPDGRLRAGRYRRRRRRPVRRRDVGADADRRDRRDRVHRAARRSCASSAPRSSTVTPEHHDALVALVSHVPQLAATHADGRRDRARRGAPRRCCGSRPAGSAT